MKTGVLLLFSDLVIQQNRIKFLYIMRIFSAKFTAKYNNSAFYFLTFIVVVFAYAVRVSQVPISGTYNYPAHMCRLVGFMSHCSQFTC